MRSFDRPKLLRLLRVVLSDHMSRDNPITMTQLIPLVLGEHVIPNKRYNQSRIIRSLVVQLRQEKMPIVSRNGKNGGYYIATNPQEIETSARLFRKRALSSLKQEALLRGIALSELFYQHPLNLEENKNVETEN